MSKRAQRKPTLVSIQQPQKQKLPRHKQRPLLRIIKLCEVEDCYERSTYGYKQKQLTRCKQHKLDGMVTNAHLYCEHNKVRSSCKDCGGGSICVHGIRRGTCRECGGNSFCEHGKAKNVCKECKGNSICEHDKVRSVCKKCKGGAICIHNRERSTCKECKGGSICIHNKRRSKCKECKGGSICIHNRERNVCKECNGSGICEHKRQRSQCIECKGGTICEHLRKRHQCKICDPDSKYFCLECRSSTSNPKYKGYCMPCYVYKFPDDELSINAHHKHDELKVKAFLANEFPGVFTHNSRIWLGDCTAPYRRYIDFYVMIGNTLFAIEVDEHQHRGYDIEDEKARINEILHNIGLDKKMVFIRYNPDAYKTDGKRQVTTMEDRLKVLKDTVVELLEILYDFREYDNIHTEIKLFYDS